MLGISIKNLLIKQQNSLKTILKDISFILPENSIYTIIGKNGSGKSTLIKSFTGLLDKRFYILEGEILLDSKNLLSLDQDELLELRREKIKYVFQDALNSFDYLKKIGYYFDRLVNNNDETEELLKYFLLPEPQNLFKLYPYEVSGGMAQRISLVLSLLTHPEIILLDEPTSGIDSPTASLVLLKLKEFVSINNNSVLLVTQDLLFAKRISDRIAFLKDGSLTNFLPVSEFFNNTVNENLDPFLKSFTEISK
ncbi:MAG: ATP-binding cassette domain-containing protein [Ignavibacteriaceae bacterium]